MEPSNEQFTQRESEPVSAPPRFDGAFRERPYDLFRGRRDVRR